MGRGASESSSNSGSSSVGSGGGSNSNSYLDRKVADVAEKQVVMLDESTTVAEAVKIMRQNDVSSVFVSRKGVPVGIVTERDVLYRVVAESRGPFKVALKDVMSSPLVTIDGSATVRDAISLMRQKGIRRLPVVAPGAGVGKEKAMLGLVTLKSVVGNMPSRSVELADVVSVPSSSGKAALAVVCPYCGSSFEGKQDLSKHIDRLHIGAGLLEGDLRQM
ncbi:CBS domain-containing protein [Nitrososphaera sp.]|uniref:CBS domain-containing protein n=1 Tax=Nitrososphaera sp. TaxID=1971748 RepID=UPI00307E4FD2